MTLYRVSDDDYIPDAASFARSIDDAEAYCANRGYGGSQVYRAVIDVDSSRILNLYDIVSPVRALADRFGFRDPGGINAEEWIPRDPSLQESIRAAGYDWVVVRDSYPEGAETWLWIGSFDREPEMERIKSCGDQ